jgi:hypothetical protein
MKKNKCRSLDVKNKCQNLNVQWRGRKWKNSKIAQTYLEKFCSSIAGRVRIIEKFQIQKEGKLGRSK